MGILRLCFVLYGLFFTAKVRSQYINNRPWPTYSLQNMPNTGFTCQDKILGGYYADPETQCQMFHVCVKVAGVGVQDFRFLCPNGTAFDQEAQICADWGDVDCEQATLYYSSDNFDLYRLGSGFESKRAPLAEEEESTFHLQRAETNDIRRSKPTIIDQRPKNDQSNDYKGSNKYNTERSTVKNPNSYSNNFEKTDRNFKTSVKPPTTKINNHQSQEDEIFKGSHSSNFFNNRHNGKDDLVDFNNEPSNSKSQHNSRRQQGRNTHRRNHNNNQVTGLNKPISSSTTETSKTTFDANSVTLDVKKRPQTLTLQASFRASDYNQYDNKGQYNPSSESPVTIATSTSYKIPITTPQTNLNVQPTTYNPSYNGFTNRLTTNQYDNQNDNLKQNPKIKPHSNHNPFYNTQFENKAANHNYDTQNQGFILKTDVNQPHNPASSQTNGAQNVRLQYNEDNFNVNKKIKKTSAIGNGRRRIDQYENQNNGNDGLQNSFRYQNDQKLRKNNENKRDYMKSEIGQISQSPSVLTVQPLSDHNMKNTFQNRTALNDDQNKNQGNTFNRRQRPENNSQNKQVVNKKVEDNFDQAVFHQTPTAFTKVAPQFKSRNTSATQENDFTRQTTYQNNQYVGVPSLQTPRGFSHSTPPPVKTNDDFTDSSRKAQTTNYNKYQTVQRNNENYTPPSSTTKKFSTHVPKDQYYPTTFKPTTYKKQIETLNTKYEKTPIVQSTVNYYSTTTQAPKQIPDEDDGQYHPELYEKDFPRKRLKLKQKLPTTYSEQSDGSEEDEFLKTAHSLNIAAGANRLRTESIKQSSPNALFKYPTTAFIKSTSSQSLSSTTSKTSTTRKPNRPNGDEDTSYDYAYYDSNNGNPHDYSEYDLISEFGKTKKQ